MRAAEFYCPPTCGGKVVPSGTKGGWARRAQVLFRGVKRWRPLCVSGFRGFGPPKAGWFRRFRGGGGALRAQVYHAAPRRRCVLTFPPFTVILSDSEGSRCLEIVTHRKVNTGQREGRFASGSEGSEGKAAPCGRIIIVPQVPHLAFGNPLCLTA